MKPLRVLHLLEATAGGTARHLELVAQYLLLYEMSGGDQIGEYVSGDFSRAILEVRLKAVDSSELAEFNAEFIDYIEENDALVRFYVSEMQGMSGKWSHMVKAQHDMHMTEYTSLVREAIERGEIPEEDPELLTAMIQGAGHAMLAVVVERDDLPYSAVIEYVDRMILRPLEERKRGEKNEEGGE